MNTIPSPTNKPYHAHLLFRLFLLFALTLSLLAGTPSIVQADDGDLDPDFDENGITTLDINGLYDSGKAVALQSDGKIIVVGYSSNLTTSDILVLRYTSDGQLDPSFGVGGIVLTSFGSSSDSASDVVIDSNGKILIAGSSDDDQRDIVLIRYNDNGSLDTTFGTNGTVTTDISGNYDIARALTIDDLGRIIVCGGTENGSDEDVVVLRYTSNGSLDESFNTDGIATTPVGSRNDYAFDVAVYDGDIYLAGQSYNETSSDAFLMKYKSNGTLDDDFGTGGIVTIPISYGYDRANTVSVLADGKILAAGYGQSGDSANYYDIFLVRYNSNGTLDSDFGTGGIVTTDVDDQDNFGVDLVVQFDGKLLVSGYSRIDSQDDILLLRYTSDGLLDESFGTNGYIHTDIIGTYDRVEDMTMQQDGKILITGCFDSLSGDQDLYVARYQNTSTSMVYLPMVAH